MIGRTLHSQTLARFLLTLPPFDSLLALNLSAFLSFVGFAWIAPGHGPVPSGMMSPGPLLSHYAIDHRPKCSWHRRRALVNVNDKSRQHYQSCEIVDDVACGDYPSGHHSVVPHQQPSDQEEHAAQGDG